MNADKNLEIAVLLIDLLSAYILGKRIVARLRALSTNPENVRHLRAV